MQFSIHSFFNLRTLTVRSHLEFSRRSFHKSLEMRARTCHMTSSKLPLEGATLTAARGKRSRGQTVKQSNHPKSDRGLNGLNAKQLKQLKQLSNRLPHVKVPTPCLLEPHHCHAPWLGKSCASWFDCADLANAEIQDMFAVKTEHVSSLC